MHRGEQDQLVGLGAGVEVDVVAGAASGKYGLAARHLELPREGGFWVGRRWCRQSDWMLPWVQSKANGSQAKQNPGTTSWKQAEQQAVHRGEQDQLVGLGEGVEDDLVAGWRSGWWCGSWILFSKAECVCVPPV